LVTTQREKATLPLELRPSQASDLIRLGSKTDGGYVVRKADVLASDGLISIGIDRNWKFERQFFRLKPVPVHAYDGCTNTAYMLQDTRIALRYCNPRWLMASVVRTLDYHWFFRGARRHFRQFVGTHEFAYEVTGSATVSFESIVAAMPGRVFLKIDVEGAEFGMLHDLVEEAPRTTGLAIEFHDCDNHLEEIVGFVGRYPLTLIHTHANSYSKLGPRGAPDALELTFSSTAFGSLGPATLPHPLDAPNDGIAEIPLHFT
jgi:hypothetical protein